MWVILIAHLLLSIIKKKANVKFASSNIATIIRLYFMSFVDLIELLKKTFLLGRKLMPCHLIKIICFRF